MNAKSLFSSGAKWSKVLSMKNLGIAISTADVGIVEVNDALCQILGYEKEELLSMNWVEITHKDDVEKDLALLDEIIDGKRVHYEIDKRYIKPDGSVTWCNIEVQRFKDEDKDVDYFIALVKDINEKKRYENLLQHQLEDTRLFLEAIQKQNKDLKEFAYLTSHNLRSPVTNILALFDLYEHSKEENDREEISQQIKTSVERLEETITYFSQYLQMLENGHKVREEIQIDDLIKKVMQQVSEDLHSGFEGLKTNLEVKKINSNPVFLESILLNLISNSIRYRKPDRPLQVEVNTRRQDKSIIIEIKDNGLGIDLEKYGNKIFGLHQTFHSHPDSSGVGLFLTKAQIEGLGGNIEVQSEVNVGTKFIIRLPVK